jgi:hypothetical protein
MAGLYFIVSGLLYWSKDYLITVLMAKPIVAQYTVTSVLFTSVLAGMITSVVVSNAVGGADSPKLKWYSLIASWLCVPFVIPIPLAPNSETFAVLVWFLLYLGAFILPIV